MTAQAEIWRGLAQVFEQAAAPRLPLDEWARKYVTITDGPRKGRWNPANAPMALEPMRAVSDGRVRQVTVCTPAQLMKSVLATNIAVWTAAYGESVLFYEPDREVLQRMFRDRMRPAFVELTDGAVQDRKGGQKKEDGALALRLQGGGLILGLTPAMKTGKSAYTARTVVLDEIDKMGDPSMITVAESRTLTYGSDAMIVAVSTPTVDMPGASWRLWTQGSRGRWHARCPKCRELVRCDWSRVKFDKDEDGFWLPATAAMHCEACDAPWGESDRQRAVRAGAYVHEDPENPHKSFHVPGTAHIFRDLRWIVDRGAQSYRQAIVEGTWDDYQQWWNERLAEPWTDEYQGLSANLMRRTTYSLGSRGKDDLGELDRRAVLVTAGVDVGAHALYGEWVAWGVDPKTGQVLCWGLQYRIIGGRPDDDVEDPDLWRDFDKALDGHVWRHPEFPGARIPVQRVLLDCGYRPDVVRIWCEERYAHEVRNAGQAMVHPYGARVLPSRGKAQEVGEHLVDLSDGRNRKVRQAPRFPAMVWLHTNMIKNTIYDIGQRDKRLPDGAAKQQMWPVNGDAHGYTEAWFREFANEVRVFHRTPKGTPTSHWQVKAGQGKKNEAWDCFDQETEVLTDHGWLRFYDLRETDRLATVNLESDQIEYQAPLVRIAREHKGRMLAISNSRVDLLVTPNHRMVTYEPTLRDGKMEWHFDDPKVTLARDLRQRHGLKITGKWAGVQHDRINVGGDWVDAGDLAAFLGWYVSEGSRSLTYAKTQRNAPRWRVQIAQNPGEKMDAILALCERLPWKAQAQPKHRKVIFTRRAIYDFVSQCGYDCYNKRVPKWIMDASPEIIERFIDTAILGDGWVDQGHRVYATTSRFLADDFQELFLKVGRSARIIRRPGVPWNIAGRSGESQEQFHVHERRTQTISLRGKKGDGYGLTVEPVDYDGMVYCATVPNGTLIVRRNGIAVVAGNCRTYATGAAVVHTQQFGPVSLQVGLLRMAIQDGLQKPGRWSDEEMGLLRRHLQIAGEQAYAGVAAVR